MVLALYKSMRLVAAFDQAVAGGLVGTEGRRLRVVEASLVAALGAATGEVDALAVVLRTNFALDTDLIEASDQATQQANVARAVQAVLGAGERLKPDDDHTNQLNDIKHT